MILASGHYSLPGNDDAEGSDVEIRIRVPRLFRPVAVASSLEHVYVQAFHLGGRESLVVPSDCDVTGKTGSMWRSFERLFAQAEHPFLEEGETIRCVVRNLSYAYQGFSFDVLGVTG